MKLIAAAFVTVALLSGKAFADDQDVIDYRQHAMKTLGEQAAVMSAMAQNKIPADNFAVHAEILAKVAAMTKSSFTQKVAGGKAKPEVWTNWDDFAKRLDALAASTADLAKTAQQGGIAAAGPKMQAALATCKACHDSYHDGPLAVARVADDKDIEYRQHVMTTLNEQAAELGMILSTAIPNDNTASHIDTLALAASVSLKAFEPKAQGGEAKPDVWSNWPDFQKRMKDFAAKTAEMSKVAHAQGPDPALEMVVGALSCKSCHDVYRAEKK
jgi:cytochrome c556